MKTLCSILVALLICIAASPFSHAAPQQDAKANPDPVEVYLNLANRLNDFERQSARRHIVQTMARSGEFDAAMALTERLKGFSKASAQESIARALARKGNQDGALAIVEKIPEISKDSAFFKVAWGLARAGKYQGTLDVISIIEGSSKIFYLCSIAEHVVRPVDKAKSRELLTEALIWAEELKGRKRAHEMAGVAHHFVQFGDNAGVQRVIGRIKKLEVKYQAEGLAGIGAAFYYEGNPAKGNELLFEALALAGRLNQQDLAKVLRFISGSVDGSDHPDMARELLTKIHALANKLKPADAAKVLDDIAYGLANAGDFKQALAAAAKLSAKEVSWRLERLANVMLEAGELNLALTTAAKLPVEDKIVIQSEVATAMAEIGALAKAKKILKTAFAEADKLKGFDRLTAQQSLAQAYGAVGDAAKAVEIINALEDDEDLTWIIANTAANLVMAGDIAGALNVVEKFNANLPYNLQYNIADFLIEGGHKAGALKYANQLQGNIKDDALLEIGKALLFKGQDLDGGLAIVRKLKGEHRAEGLHAAGRTFAKAGKKAQAQRLLAEAFTAAMEQTNKDKVIHLAWIADSMMDTGAKAQALKHLHLCIPLAKQLDGQDKSDVLNSIAESLIRCGDSGEALSLAKELKGDPLHYRLFEIIKPILLQRKRDPKSPKYFFYTLNPKLTPEELKTVRQIVSLLK